MHQSVDTTVIHRCNIILESSPQSVPLARSFAMYRDPLASEGRDHYYHWLRPTRYVSLFGDYHVGVCGGCNLG